MSHVPEPHFSLESDLEDAVVEEVSGILESARADTESVQTFFLLRHFGLDVGAFIDIGERAAAKFIEIKAFTGGRAGGVGFGNQRGLGRQVDLLSLADEDIALADQFVCWILGNALEPAGSERFVFFSSIEAREAAMGNVSSGKQNNLNLRRLMTKAVTWEVLCDRLAEFLVPRQS